MFTLIYNYGQFNRPDTLVPFLESNIGEYPLLQVDCVTPFSGRKDVLIKAVCEYLSKIVPVIEVKPNITPESSAESNEKGVFVNYLALQVHVQKTIKGLL
jgi:hypothetical protein